VLKVLNEFYLIEPEDLKVQVDKRSGLTEDVVGALDSGKLFIPEAYEYAALKLPMRGKVVAYGDKRRYTDILVGDVVGFGQYSYAKFMFEGKEYLEVHEKDLLYVIKLDEAGGQIC
jgi:co-chaperonin GroES (HSP10)